MILVVGVCAVMVTGLAIFAVVARQRARWQNVAHEFLTRMGAVEKDNVYHWTGADGTQYLWDATPVGPLQLVVDAGLPECSFATLSTTKPAPYRPSRNLETVPASPRATHRLSSTDPAWIEHCLSFGMARYLTAAPTISFHLQPNGRLSAHPLADLSWDPTSLDLAQKALGQLGAIMRGKAPE